MSSKSFILSWSISLAIALYGVQANAGPLKTHGIFSSNMVIQRDKPIVIWGWAEAGSKVSVQLGQEKAEATADGEAGRWEVTFEAKEADATPRNLAIASGDEKIDMDNIVIGDVWVMNGQSNMAFGLGKVYRGDLEMATAHLPLLREVRISSNEQYALQEDLPAEVVSGWTVSTPETAGGYSAIGYVFGSRLQRALQIPIGIIDNARGGASIESLTPRHKFDDHPLAAKYLAWVEQRRAEFDWEAAVQKLVEKWEQDVAQRREKGVAEDQLPPKPTRKNLRSWSVPGRSPMDAASCYNGMFGVFQELNITGVLFHQGYNNAAGDCRPKRYRVLMKLMVEGWREDFNDPKLPVGVIEFCAGSISQSDANFEIWTNHRTGGAFIREAQRQGLADLNDPEHTGFIPGYDQQIPGLHPKKKHFHGVRAARWALKNVYGLPVGWDTAELVSAARDGDKMVLTFDTPVMPDNMSMDLEGFSIADESGKFYRAHAAHPQKNDFGIWNTVNKNYDTKTIYVWSPLVKEPVAVRYAWATSPMGNLKVNGLPWQPLHSFRTDSWDLPETDDPSQPGMSRDQSRQLELDSIKYCEQRRMDEAKRAVEILEKLKTLGKQAPGAGP